MACAYQGEPGAYSEQCATDIFAAAGRKVEFIGLGSFDEVFASLAEGKVEYAAVPVENTLGGSIHVNYDLLLRYHGQVHILGEHVHRVRHTLMALPGVRKEDIKKAMSHEQALAQTDNYLRNAGITPVKAYDTAGSAKLVREGDMRDTAAIASARAAEVHGLVVLDAGIEDDSNNFTRFLLLGRASPVLPEDSVLKTSVVFVPHSNEAGALFKALSVFAVREIDLSKIESRPYRPGSFGTAVAHAAAAATMSRSSSASKNLNQEAPPSAKRSRVEAGGEEAGGEGAHMPYRGAAKFQYAFYVDLLAGRAEERCVNALRHLRELSAFCVLLGSFPKDGVAFEARPAELGAAALVCRPAASLRTEPLRVGVVGFGTFGQFLARRWVSRGHRVLATSRTDYSDLAASMGVDYFKSVAELSEQELDVVLVSTSIMSFEAVLKTLPSSLTKGKLVVDVLSVKSHAKVKMQQLLPAEADLLCLHPMFGPESGKDDWQGLPLVYEGVRVVDHHRAARFLSLFEEEGCKMVKMSCERHDELAAGSQFVTHLTGRLLGRLGLPVNPIATKGYRALLQLVDNTQKDSFDLFYALYSHNPASGKTLADFAKAFEELRSELLQGGTDTKALK